MSEKQLPGDRESYGVSIGFLKRFQRYVNSCLPGATTRKVVDSIIKKVTVQQKRAYNNMDWDSYQPVFKSEPPQLAIVDIGKQRPVNYFISHSWSMAFDVLITRIVDGMRVIVGQSANLDETFVWLDIFALNQHVWGGSENLEKNLHSKVYGSTKVLVCLPPPKLLNTDADPLTRIWCLLEMAYTTQVSWMRIQWGQKLYFAADPAMDYNAFLTHVFNLDINRAKCTDDRERQALMDNILKVHGSLERVHEQLVIGFQYLFQEHGIWNILPAFQQRDLSLVTYL